MVTHGQGRHKVNVEYENMTLNTTLDILSSYSSDVEGHIFIFNVDGVATLDMFMGDHGFIQSDCVSTGRPLSTICGSGHL